MHVAQSGIFALGTGSHSYLEFDLLEHADPLTLVQACGSGWQALPIIRSSMSREKRLLPWPRLQSLLLKSPGGPTRRVGT